MINRYGRYTWSIMCLGFKMLYKYLLYATFVPIVASFLELPIYVILSVTWLLPYVLSILNFKKERIVTVSQEIVSQLVVLKNLDPSLDEFVVKERITNAAKTISMTNFNRMSALELDDVLVNSVECAIALYLHRTRENHVFHASRNCL